MNLFNAKTATHLFLSFALFATRGVLQMLLNLNGTSSSLAGFVNGVFLGAVMVFLLITACHQQPRSLRCVGGMFA